MPTTFKQLAAASALALLLPTGAQASCSAAGHWSDLGPPSFGSLRDLPEAQAGVLPGCAPAGVDALGLDSHFAALSFDDGPRALTHADAPPPQAERRMVAAHDDRDLLAPAADTSSHDADVDRDDFFAPMALGLFLAGFVGVALFALRRRRP